MSNKSCLLYTPLPKKREYKNQKQPVYYLYLFAVWLGMRNLEPFSVEGVDKPVV
jgi:hypothetical protein